MKIHNLYITASFATLLLSFSACNDFLDKLPDNRMELNTEKKVQKFLVSAYPNRNPALLAELYSDNTDEFKNTGWTSAGRFQDQAYRWDDITEVSDYESPQELWNSHYMAIATANTALQAIAKLDETPTTKASKGEALLCRAYAAFNLANTFCMAYNATTANDFLGLPYPLEPETTIGIKYKRGTLKAFYDQINQDIEAALPLITDNYERPKFHFNRNAAYAFAALFNLYYQKYDKAVAYATRVLGANPATTLRDWKAFYALSPNGDIAPNAYINTQNTANLFLQTVYSEAGLYLGPYGYAAKYAHGQLLTETEDMQSDGPWGHSADFGYTIFSNNSLSKYFINKIPYSFEYNDIQAGTGYPHTEYAVFTTDKTLLVRAEAYALQGNYAAAVADLNTEVAAMSGGTMSVTLAGIKAFYAGLQEYTPTAPTPKKKFNAPFTIESTTQEPVLQAILHLRRILTLGEGVRLQDVKRYGIVIYRRVSNTRAQIVAVTDTMKVDDPRRAIQIPQDVITAGLPGNPRNK